MNHFLIAIAGAVGFALIYESQASAAPPDQATGAPNMPPVDYSKAHFIDLFKRYGGQYGVDPLWLQAFCMNESSMGDNELVKAGAVSTDGLSYGIMQLTVTTANDFEPVTPDDLNNPDTSVRIAAQFIASLKKQFDTSDPRFTEWVVKSYNQGAGATKKERDGLREGAAQAYFERWLRNINLIGGDL